MKEIAERLKGFRESLDLSPEEMAAECGVNVETLQKYESGDYDIPLSFLQRLSSRKGVELAVLMFGEEPKASNYFITRKGKGKKVERSEAYSYLNLAVGFQKIKITPFLVTIAPEHTAGTARQPNYHDGQEFNYVLEGEMEITIGTMSTVLHEGDSILFDATIPHAMRAIGDKEAKIIAILN